MITLRCSSVGRVLSCPASLTPPAIVIEGDNTAARLGTAAHRCAEMHVKGEYVSLEDTHAIAAEFAVDVEELRMLSNMARQCWESLSQHFPAPTVEQPFASIDLDNGITLSGHPDAFSIVDGQVRVVDFKTGRVEGDFDDQLKGYLYLITRSLPEVDTAWGATIHVRTRTIGDPIQMTRGELDDWYSDLVRTVKQDHYRPSHEACQYCPRRFECDARRQMLQASIGVLVGIDESTIGMALGSIPDEAMRTGVLTAKHVKALCEQYLDAAKTEVLIRGSHQEDMNAVSIDGLQVRNQDRRQLAVAESWPILTRVLSLPVVKECLTISKTKVEKAIGDIAPPRGKAKLIKEVMDELDAAGAITVNTAQILEVRQTRAIN